MEFHYCHITEESDKDFQREEKTTLHVTSRKNMSRSEEVKFKEIAAKEEELFSYEKGLKIQKNLKEEIYSHRSKTVNSLVRDNESIRHNKPKKISRNRTVATPRSKVREGHKVKGSIARLKKKKLSVSDKVNKEDSSDEVDFDSSLV